MDSRNDAVSIKQLAKRRPNVHGFCWVAMAVTLLSFGYLLTAGELAHYGYDHNDLEVQGVVFPAWDHGWPLRFMVRGPFLDVDSLNDLHPSSRWPVGGSREAFSWTKLFLDLVVIAAVTFGCGYAAQRFLGWSSFRFRLSHLLVLVAWLATGIAMLVHVEQQRTPMLSISEESQPHPEYVKRILYDHDTPFDAVPTTIAFVALGLFWWSVIDGAGRLCDYAVQRWKAWRQSSGSSGEGG